MVARVAIGGHRGLPVASSYRPFLTGLGVLAAYLAAALSLTYYMRGRVGARRWRRAHRLIPVAWALAAVHVVGAGTDAGSLWLQLPVALTAALVIALLGERVLGARRRPRAIRTPFARRTRGADASGRHLTRATPPDSA